MDYFMSTKTSILENKELRAPQVNAYVEVYNHFIDKKNTSHAIVVLPTGTGKTGLISILPYNIAQGRVLVIAPQLTILSTIETSLNSMDGNNFWLQRKVITNPKRLPVVVKYEGEESRREHLEDANIVLANIQKLQKRNEMALLNQYPEDFFDMIIIDEAHHSEAKTWIENLQHFSEAKVIKITATPYRTDKKNIVGKLVYKYKLSQAMHKKYVKSLEKFNYIPDELYLTIDNNKHKKYTIEEIRSLNLKDEDWVSRSVAYSDECKQSVVKRSVEVLQKKRKGSSVPHKIIAAAPNITEAESIASMYSELNYKSVAIHNDLPEDEKERIFRDIENHRVDVVVNVSMMGEGYDHKYLSVAAIFRAFRSILPYEQFIGRILRSIPEEEIQKSSDNIGSVVVHEYLNLDELWNYYRHQLQESDFIEELEGIEDELIEGDKDNNGIGDVIPVDFGDVNESEDGQLTKSVYLETDYIVTRRREEEKRREKISKIKETLKVSEKEAVSIVDESEESDNTLKRPDLILKTRKKSTNKNIQEQIVPELLRVSGLDIHGEELKHLPIFSGQYSWIKSKKTNGAMLAIYFNTYLKNQIGLARANWSNDDFERAATLLDQQTEYVRNFLMGD